MVICQKCGYDNELGRIFCHSCGTKLNLSEIKSPSQGGKSLAKKKTGGVGRSFFRILNVAILAALVTIICLAVQVPTLRPITTTNEDAASADTKRIEFDDLLLGPNKPSTIRVSEAELNAFINSLGFSKAAPRTLEVVPTRLQLELGDGVVTAIFVGKLQIAGSVAVPVCLSYTGVPTVEGGQFVFKRVGGSLGALPINPWILEKTGVFDHYYAKVFGNLSQERQVLGMLTSISVSPKEAVLTYLPH